MTIENFGKPVATLPRTPPITKNGASSSRLSTVVWLAVAIWSLAMIWIAFKSGVRHDYHDYLEQWNLVLWGRHPWSTDNAYGPLHNVLAYLLCFGPLGPKMLIAAALLSANGLLIWDLYRSIGVGRLFSLYVLAVPANVLVIIVAFVYGLNDALVASLVVVAMVARHHGHLIVAGCFLGLAVLLKYYPIVLVPLFALEAGHIRARLILAAAAIVLIGMGLTALVWGDAFIKAIAFAIERGPKILSILAALSSYPSLIGGQDVLDILIRTNVVFLAAAGVLIFWIAWRAKLHWLEASVLGFLTVLVIYKVGHPQFYLPWLFLVAALPLAGTPSSRQFGWLCLPLVLFLSAFQWGYTYGDGYRDVWGFVRRDVGFFAFSLSIATIAGYFFCRRALAQQTDTLSKRSRP